MGFADLLPQHDGLLPYMLLYGTFTALVHTVVCYKANPQAALKAFSGPKRPAPTSLLAHVYGTKNVYTSLIRLYAAYHITNPQLYDLALATQIGVLLLYGSEMFIWQTVRMREAAFPFVTAGTGLIWMLAQRSFYIG